MLTSFVSHRRPWWLGLALAWAAWPAAAEPATPAAATPPPPLRAAASAPASEPQARFAEPEETVGPAAGKLGFRVVPIDFESSTLDKETLKAVSQALWERLDAMADLALYPSGATRRWLIRHDLFPFTPYLPPPPPERITGALKADTLITGQLNRTGGVFVLELSVYSDRARQYILKDLKLEKATEAELLEALGPLSAQLHQAITGNAAAAAPNQSGAKAAEAPAAKGAPTKAKAKSAATTRKTPTKVRVTAKSRTTASRTAARKTKGTPAAVIRRAESRHAATVPPAAAVQTARQESDEGKAIPAVQPTPRVTPAPTARATPKPAAAVNATPTPAPPAKPTKTHAPTDAERAAAPGEAPAREPAPAAAHAAEAATPAGTEPAADPARARELFEQARRSGTPAEERLSLLAQAARLAPADAEIQQQLALEHYGQGDYAACIAQCEQAAARLPKTAMLWVIKGSAFYELGRYDEAIEANREALRLDPKNVWGHFNLALALTHKAPDQAIPAWRNFIAMFGDDPEHKALVEQARASLSGLGAAAQK